MIQDLKKKIVFLIPSSSNFASKICCRGVIISDTGDKDESTKLKLKFTIDNSIFLSDFNRIFQQIKKTIQTEYF